jgi:hypothetical protein
VRLEGVNATVAPTCTVVLAEVYPGADAVMVAPPMFAPVI